MRVALAVAVFALCAARGAASGEPPEPPAPQPSWAQPAIAVVVAHGLLAADVDSFRPDDPLTAGDLAALATGLSGAEAAAPADPSAPVTIARLDAVLARAVGLGPAASHLEEAARAAGLAPPAFFGTEAVARLLRLRTDHADDRLELAATDTATRAEA